jgi:hypothetical protein
LGFDQNAGKATVFVDRAKKLLTSEFDGEVSLTKFKDITISGTLTADTLKYTTLDPAIPQAIQYAQTLYVDANGEDSNVGNAAFPVKTISKAVQMACDGYVADGKIRTVHVASGQYTETVTITKPLQLVGSSPSRYAKECSLNGSVLVQVSGTTDLHASKVSILNMLISGRVVDTSSSVHVLLVKDAFIYGPDHCIHQNTSSLVDSRTYIENVTINGSNATSIIPLVEIVSGVLIMSQCALSSKALQNVLTVSGTAEVWNTSLNTFENSHNGSYVPALVRLSTSKYNKFKVFAYSSFSYTSATQKVNGQNQNTAIWVDGTNTSYLYLVSNNFSLAGVVSGNVVDSAAGGTMIYYSNNYSASSSVAPMASGLVGVLNTNKFQMMPVS